MLQMNIALGLAEVQLNLPPVKRSRACLVDVWNPPEQFIQKLMMFIDETSLTQQDSVAVQCLLNNRQYYLQHLLNRYKLGGVHVAWRRTGFHLPRNGILFLSIHSTKICEIRLFGELRSIRPQNNRDGHCNSRLKEDFHLINIFGMSVPNGSLSDGSWDCKIVGILCNNMEAEVLFHFHSFNEFIDFTFLICLFLKL